MRRGAVLLALLLVLPACSDGGDSSPSANPRASRSRPVENTDSPGKGLKEREQTGPQGVRVMNDALGDAKALTRQAIDDLQRLGFWKPLTRKIYGIRITSRQGGTNVPDDGHLADSLWTYFRHDATGEWGDLCDVLFYTRAVKDDVARQRVYYAQGRLDHPPPTLRQFWAVLLGHEIAHCSREGQKGEALSTRWESRILSGYGIDRIGSP